MTSDHPTFDQLADLAGGQLPPEAQAQMQAHIVTCQACAADLTWLENIIDVMRLAGAERPPPAAAAHVRALLRTHRTPPKRNVATLRFDSARSPLAAGMRTDPSDERQLVLAADPFTIDLHLAPAEDRWAVNGQILGPTTSGAIELASSSEVFHADLTDFCEFALALVPTGRYALTVRLTDIEIFFPELEVGT
jgi:anti-sigma factor RsiW